MVCAATAAYYLRPAYLYDARFDENLGMYLVRALAWLAAALACAAFAVADRRRSGLRVVGVVIPVVVLAATLWVQGHHDGCALGCGPYLSSSGGSRTRDVRTGAHM